MNETRILSQWVVDTRYDDLPSEVVEAVRIYILDDLASGFAGARLPWTSMVAEMVNESSSGPCSVFGREWTAAPAAAALVNGVAIGGFETDHPFTAGSCHPSGAVFPAVLAAAETAKIDGRQFIAAVATGYEALCHVGLAATRAVEDERGFHGPGTNAPVGGAFGAAKALGLDLETTVNAIGIAVSHGGGLLEFFREGAMTKRLHLGRGAQLGLESALLARRGFTGPSTALEGEKGFLRVYSPAPRVELLTQDLGLKYALLGMTLKAYPCHVSFHAVVDAIQRFKREQAFDPAEVEAVSVISTARMMEERFAARAPTTLMGAQYSLPWSTAHALWHDAEDPATWSEAALADANVNKLAAAVDLREEEPSQAGAVAELRLSAGGRQHVIFATDWKGAPSNPYTYDDMARKFRRYSAGVIPDARAQEIVERVAALESQPGVSQLAALIRG